MLNSIFDKKPQRIKLDKIVYQDANAPNQLLFTNDPDEIETLSINHFKNIGSCEASSTRFHKHHPLIEPWHLYTNQKIYHQR